MKKTFLVAVILLICLFFVGCIARDEQTADGHESDVSKENVTEGSKNFTVSETGKVLTVNEKVAELSHELFADLPTGIETIYIGSGVEFIANDTFRGLSALKAVHVDEENKHYVSSENGKYIAALDGSSIFVFGSVQFDSLALFFADSLDGKPFDDKDVSYNMGEMTVYLETWSKGKYDHDELYLRCQVNEIEAFGQTVEFQETFGGDRPMMEISCTDDYALIQLRGNSAFLFDGGKCSLECELNYNYYDENYNYNAPITSYHIEENGSITFYCQPMKYIFSPAAGENLMYSTGLDEIYLISGTAVLVDGEPELTVQETMLLKDRHSKESLQYEFECVPLSWRNGIESIDEYFEYNRTRFETFEFNENKKGERKNE